MIARRAIEIADADLVTVGLLTAGGNELLVEVALGVGRRRLCSGGGSRSRTTVAGRRSRRSPAAARASRGEPARHAVSSASIRVR